MQAVGDKLIIKAILKEETTQGGIIVAEAVKTPPNEGTVLSVGEEVKFVKKGDHIMFSPYDYDEIDKEIFVMCEYSVWLKIEKTK